MNKNFPLKFKVLLATKDLTLEEFMLIDSKEPYYLHTNKKVNDIFDICIDDRIVARGEIIVIDGLFGIQINEIVENERILSTTSIHLELVFGTFEMSLNDFEKLSVGMVISLNKPLYNTLDSILTNGVNSCQEYLNIEFNYDNRFVISLFEKNEFESSGLSIKNITRTK